MVKIFCVNTQTSKTFPEGTTLLEMLPEFGFEKPYPILAALVNNVCQGLKYRAFNSRQVEFLDYRSYTGRSVYCRSLCFLLCKAARDVFPQCKTVLRRPISKGYFCSIDKGDSTPLTAADLEMIKERMDAIVAADMPFRRHEVRLEEAIGLFSSLGHGDKVKLLETSGDVYVNYYTLDDTPDYYYDALLFEHGLYDGVEPEHVQGRASASCAGQAQAGGTGSFHGAVQDVRGVFGESEMEQDYGPG